MLFRGDEDTETETEAESQASRSNASAKRFTDSHDDATRLFFSARIVRSRSLCRICGVAAKGVDSSDVEVDKIDAYVGLGGLARKREEMGREVERIGAAGKTGRQEVRKTGRRLSSQGTDEGV